MSKQTDRYHIPLALGRCSEGSGHDERWCSSCENFLDGYDEGAAQKLKRIVRWLREQGCSGDTVFDELCDDDAGHIDKRCPINLANRLERGLEREEECGCGRRDCTDLPPENRNYD